MSHAAVRSPRSKDAVGIVSAAILVSINSAGAKKFNKNVSSQFMTVRFKYFKWWFQRLFMFTPKLGGNCSFATS